MFFNSLCWQSDSRFQAITGLASNCGFQRHAGYFKGSLPCKAYLQQTSATTQADGKCSTNWRPGRYGLRKTSSSRPHWSELRAWTTRLKHLRDRTDSNDSARKGTFVLADHCLLYLREEPSNKYHGLNCDLCAWGFKRFHAPAKCRGTAFATRLGVPLLSKFFHFKKNSAQCSFVGKLFFHRVRTWLNRLIRLLKLSKDRRTWRTYQWINEPTLETGSDLVP